MAFSLEKLFSALSLSNPSSDSDQNLQPHPAYVDHSLSTDEAARRDAIIKEINEKVRAGQEVDLSKYPPLFVAHYRGIHFFKQFATQEQRRQVRNSIKNKTHREGMYSPAVYELAKLRLGEPIDTNQKKQAMRRAITTLRAQFKQFAATKGTQSWYGKKFIHPTLLCQHHQRYVNNYQEFRQESTARTQDCYKVLSSSANPYVSSANVERHAVLYAMGAKSDEQHGCLRPAYDDTLKAKHPKVGYVQTIFHSLQSLSRTPPLPLSTLQASRHVEIDSRILQERETTFTAAIGARHIVNRTIVRYPSMNVPFQASAHPAKYGIQSARSYNPFKKSLKERAPSSGLVSDLATHYGNQIQNQALKIAREKNGFLVYLDLDGTLRSALPPTTEITNIKQSARALHLYSDFQSHLSMYKGTENDSDSFDELNVVDDEPLTITLSQEEMTSLLQKSQTAQGLEEIKILLDQGKLSVNAHLENTALSILQHAGSYELWDLANLLLTRNADIRREFDTAKNTVLHHYAANGDAASIKTCLERAPDIINWQNAEGLTALHYAAFYGRFEAVQVLCANPNCNVGIPNTNQETCLDLANAKGHTQIATVLIEAQPKNNGYETEVERKTTR